MLKIDKEALDHLEKQHPGIGESIRAREAATRPACPRCGAGDIADVGAGVIGRTIALAAATTKFKLIANGPRRGKYFCNACSKFFN